MRIRHIMAAAVAALLIARGAAAQAPSGAGEGWQGEFEHAARQISELAEAVPAEKYSWRPGPGVRSVAEVYMHIAIGNYFLLGQAGVKPSVDLAKMGKDPEKSITAKADVIKFLKGSFDAVRSGAPTVDRTKKVQFFGKETTADGVLLRLLVHNHEHMGQSIAYARMNGVVPPWSKGTGQ